MGANWSVGRGVKRPHENTEPDNEASTSDLGDTPSDLHTPKRKRFQSTAQYIVKKLFEEGTDSDVTIRALGKTWQLHRIYLSQCKYFDSMFSGQWLESDQPNITIEITDENVDVEALRIAFKSLYTDNILVKPIQAVGVLAAATFLQLDPLIEHCRSVMKGCITYQTACQFLAAGESYGLLDVRDLCTAWLLRSLMVPKNSIMLAEISEELLTSLLDSQDLWIMQVEVDIYCLLRKWAFLQLHPTWSGNSEQLFHDACDFYRRLAEDNSCCFLETRAGQRFIPLFQRVRWPYILNDTSCIQTLVEERLVPIEWLSPVFRYCWNHHLRMEQGLDIGPREVSEEDFHRWAMRCGRILTHEQEYHWRWLGYTYGLDLLFTLRNRVLTVSRNCGTSQRYPGSLSQQDTRRVMLCVRISPVRKKEVSPTFTTAVKTLDLHTLDVEVFLMALCPSVKFPLQVTMQLLYITPHPPLPFPSLAVPPPPPPPSTHPASVGAGDRPSAACAVGGGSPQEPSRGAESQTLSTVPQGDIVHPSQRGSDTDTGSDTERDRDAQGGSEPERGTDSDSGTRRNGDSPRSRDSPRIRDSPRNRQTRRSSDTGTGSDTERGRDAQGGGESERGTESDRATQRNRDSPRNRDRQRSRDTQGGGESERGTESDRATQRNRDSPRNRDRQRGRDTPTGIEVHASKASRELSLTAQLPSTSTSTSTPPASTESSVQGSSGGNLEHSTPRPGALSAADSRAGDEDSVEGDSAAVSATPAADADRAEFTPSSDRAKFSPFSDRAKSSPSSDRTKSSPPTTVSLSVPAPCVSSTAPCSAEVQETQETADSKSSGSSVGRGTPSTPQDQPAPPGDVTRDLGSSPALSASLVRGHLAPRNVRRSARLRCSQRKLLH